MLYYFIKQQVKARGLVWVSEDTEDAGTPFLRAFLPKGPCWTSPLQHPRLIWSHTLLLAAPGTVPSSQPGRLQPGKSRSSMSWRLGSRFLGRSMFLCCHLALVQSINSQCLGEALAEQGSEDAQREPETCATRAFKNCYLQPLQFCLFSPIPSSVFCLYFLGKWQHKLRHKVWFHV